MAISKRKSKKNLNNISSIVGLDRWVYNIIPITVKKTHSSYRISEKNAREEDLREAIKLYAPESKEISYLADDKLSIVSKLANYTSVFVCVYVLEERGKVQDYESMHKRIEEIL